MAYNFGVTKTGTAGGGGVNPFLKDYSGGGGRGYLTYSDLVKGTQWEQEQRNKSASRIAPAPQYEPLAITKNPWLKDFTLGLQDELKKASGTMPDFTQMLADLKSAQGGVTKAFDRYGESLNLDAYIGAQRGGDAELRTRTGALANDVGALGNSYADVLADYERRGTGALDTELGNARDFSNRLIPQAIDDARADVRKHGKLYDFMDEGGFSSGLAGKIAAESTRAALPFMLEGSRYTGNVLGKYQPFLGDVASRQANKVAFDYQAGNAMYDRYGNLISQEKGTAANIQQLQMAVAREGVDMAIRRFVTDFQTAQMLAQAANLPVEIILQRAQAAGVLGGMSPLYQYEDVKGPDADLQSPTGFNNALPGYPQPTRYVPQQGNAQDGTGPNARGWVDWNQARPTGSSPSGTFGGPNDGGGYVNGTYLGTDAWRNPEQVSRAAREHIYTPEGRQDYFDAYGVNPPQPPAENPNYPPGFFDALQRYNKSKLEGTR